MKPQNQKQMENSIHLTTDVVLKKSDVKQITSKEGMYLQPGDVVLVRSENVKKKGDHFIIITGNPVLKAHGFRPKSISIATKSNSKLLDEHQPMNGVVLLKLNDLAKQTFLIFNHQFEKLFLNNFQHSKL